MTDQSEVHRRALDVPRGAWSIVLSLPLVCEDIGEDCPEWAWRLCEHAAAVTEAAPVEVLTAVCQAARDADGAPCDAAVAAMGEGLGLCNVAAKGGETWIISTPFGEAVALLHERTQGPDWPR